MTIYSEIISFVESIKELGQNIILQPLENEIIKGRDRIKDPIPIYLTKWRIKNPHSIYVKLKLRKKKLEVIEIKNIFKEIDDIFGLRVLCLFEQDILLTHRYILEVLKPSYKLKEFELFNWQKDYHDKQYSDLLIKEVEKRFESVKIEHNPKRSGYKSIHYKIEINHAGEDYPIEIQLRTLFQDAWAELEHTLSYKKGPIHPHIKKSFDLLARDLETNDSLVAHLKDISDKEISGRKYSLENIGPHKYLYYDYELIPDIFKELGDVKKKYKKYERQISKINPREKGKDWLKKLKEAKKLYTIIIRSISGEDVDDPKVDYWKEMEKAFFQFCEGNYDKAMEIYEQQKKKYPDRYVVYFRIGEIYFIKGEITDALIAFDTCESLLPENDFSNYENIFRLKIKFGYIYWLLGEEYIDIALRQIIEAKKIYDDNKYRGKYFTNEDYYRLVNNLCYYHLEKYIWCYDIYKLTNKGDKKYSEVQREYEKSLENLQKHFHELEKLMDKDIDISNLYDTIAWYYYHMYLKEWDNKLLELSKEYCQKIYPKTNYSAYVLESANLQMKHIQEIMNATL